MLLRFLIALVSSLFLFSAISTTPAYSIVDLVQEKTIPKIYSNIACRHENLSPTVLITKHYYTFRQDNKDIYAIPITIKLLAGFVKVLGFLLTISASILYPRQILNVIENLLINSHRQFTSDREIIDFTTNINPDFKNRYSIKYSKKQQTNKTFAPSSELEAEEYRHLIDRNSLIEKISSLFEQYRQDWTTQDFESIKAYSLEPLTSFINSQKEQKHCETIYKYGLLKTTPLNFDFREELKRFVVQIDYEAVKLELSDQGYILSGEPELQFFVEYWDIALDADNKCYLIAIAQKQHN